MGPEKRQIDNDSHEVDSVILSDSRVRRSRSTASVACTKPHMREQGRECCPSDRSPNLRLRAACTTADADNPDLSCCDGAAGILAKSNMFFEWGS